jgi:monovalent cation:H+ antiporter-2, CPA2 family
MMPHNLDLIFTLTGALVAALAFGLLTRRIGLSPIIGYMVAGIFLGRHAAGFVANYDIASELAEIGVILLMFGVGLQFNLKELLAVRAVAIPGALVQIALTTALGAITAHGFGWNWGAGILFGLSISVASTVVLTRILSENNALHTQTGHIAIGWLVVEDIFTVLVLVLVPALAGQGGQHTDNAVLSIGSAVGKIALLIAITFFVGKRWLPEFLGWVAATRSRELFTLSVLAVALGIGVGSATLFGASMALGAFLAGMIVNQSAYSHRAAIEALPMRDAFAVLFFVSVGMLFNPWNFNQEWWMIALTCLVILVGKPIAALLVVRMLNYPVHVGLSVAIALSQIGEFSFILATLGKELKILPGTAVDVLVASSMISITLNPVLYRLARPTAKLIGQNRVLRWLLDPAASARGAEQRNEEKGITPRQRAIVIGYGPIGRLVVRLLQENEIEPTIVELNPKTVELLCAQGIRAIYGDASHIETLRVAGLEKTKNLILTASELSGAVELIRAARDANPKVHIVVRTVRLETKKSLLEAGADRVFSAEGEMALSITECLLESLGATQEQLEANRDSIRKRVSVLSFS